MSTDASPAAHVRPGGSAGALVSVSIALVIYALSPGPVVRFMKPSSHGSLEVFYAPIILLYREVPPVQAFYDWYLDLWDFR